MVRSSLAIALAACGCGQVAHEGVDAATDAVADAAPAVTYKGSLGETAPVTFGGKPYCSYTITLKQLDLELQILPSKAVVSGKAQALNMEAVVQPCTNGAMPAGIAKYTFAPATPAPGGTSLVFAGDPANAPVVTLSVDLVAAGNVYQANLGFLRTDSPVASINWAVVATIPLTAP